MRTEEEAAKLAAKEQELASMDPKNWLMRNALHYDIKALTPPADCTCGTPRYRHRYTRHGYYSPFCGMATGRRSPISETPRRDSLPGNSRTWTRIIYGVPFSFTAVVMPDGERRYKVRRYNGYGDDGSVEGRAQGMRFDCAWSQAHFITVKPQECA